ncbi:hypothetical protein Tco_0306709, partial [Tanacetum coccineum]
GGGVAFAATAAMVVLDGDAVRWRSRWWWWLLRRDGGCVGGLMVDRWWSVVGMAWSGGGMGGGFAGFWSEYQWWRRDLERGGE